MNKIWINNLDKLSNNDWIFKLITMNYLNNNINIDDKFYEYNIKEIKDLLNKNSFSLIRDLILYREQINNEHSKLSEFNLNLNFDNFISKYKNNSILFNNYGYPNSSKELINFNKNITNNLIDNISYKSLSEDNINCLKESIKSCVGWKKVDLSKHAIGSLEQIIDLTLSRLIFTVETNKEKKREKIGFILNILKPYIQDDSFEDLVFKTMYTGINFNLPFWKDKDNKVRVISVFDITSNQDNSLLYNLNKYLNINNSAKLSGSSELLVLVLYNLFNNTVKKLHYIYNQLFDRIKNNNKIGNKEIIKNSIKKSINSLDIFFNDKIKLIFGLDNNIKLLNSLNKYPLENESNSNEALYRVLGGERKILKKELCLTENYPLVLKYDENGVFTGDLDYDESKNKLLDLFLKTEDNEYLGGIILYKPIIQKTLVYLRKFINNIINIKLKILQIIDNEFEHMIKGIKIKKASIISKELQSEYKSLIKFKDSMSKQIFIKSLIRKLESRYKEFKDLEFEYLNDIIFLKNDLESETNELKRQDFVKITRKLILQYFSVKNESYVFKLLSNEIYSALKNVINQRNSTILPFDFLDKLNESFNKVDKSFESKINKLDKNNLNNFENKIKMRGGSKVNYFNYFDINVSDIPIRNTDDINYLKELYKDQKFKNLNQNRKLQILQKFIINDHYWNKVPFKNKTKTKNKNKKSELNIVRNSTNIKIPEKSLLLNYWKTTITKLPRTRGKAKNFYMVFKNDMNSLKLFDLYYGTINEKISNKAISSISDDYDKFVLITLNKSDLKEDWRLLKKTFVDNLMKKNLISVRKEIYKLIFSKEYFIENTKTWKENNSSKDMIQNYKLISRRELVKFM